MAELGPHGLLRMLVDLLDEHVQVERQRRELVVGPWHRDRGEHLAWRDRVAAKLEAGESLIASDQPDQKLLGYLQQTAWERAWQALWLELHALKVTVVGEAPDSGPGETMLRDQVAAAKRGGRISQRVFEKYPEHKLLDSALHWLSRMGFAKQLAKRADVEWRDEWADPTPPEAGPLPQPWIKPEPQTPGGFCKIKREQRRAVGWGEILSALGLPDTPKNRARVANRNSSKIHPGPIWDDRATRQPCAPIPRLVEWWGDFKRINAMARKPPAQEKARQDQGPGGQAV